MTFHLLGKIQQFTQLWLGLFYLCNSEMVTSNHNTNQVIWNIWLWIIYTVKGDRDDGSTIAQKCFFLFCFFKSSQITLSEKEIHLFKTFICCIRLKHHCLVLKLQSTEATSLALGPYYLFMWLWHWQQKHCVTKTFHLKYVNRKKEIKAWIKGTKAFLSKKNCNFLRQQNLAYVES